MIIHLKSGSHTEGTIKESVIEINSETTEESEKLDNFADGKLNMIDFVANDNQGRRTSFILRRF